MANLNARQGLRFSQLDVAGAGGRPRDVNLLAGA